MFVVNDFPGRRFDSIEELKLFRKQRDSIIQHINEKQQENEHYLLVEVTPNTPE